MDEAEAERCNELDVTTVRGGGMAVVCVMLDGMPSCSDAVACTRGETGVDWAGVV